jgi:hypothetical protein
MIMVISNLGVVGIILLIHYFGYDINIKQLVICERFDLIFICYNVFMIMRKQFIRYPNERANYFCINPEKKNPFFEKSKL